MNDHPAGQAIPLQPMAAYVTCCPPGEPFRAREQHLVYLHPFKRVKLTIEATPEMCYGLQREEALGDAGVFGAEADSQEFATTLIESLSCHLSLGNLEHLKLAIDAEIESHRRSDLAHPKS